VSRNKSGSVWGFNIDSVLPKLFSGDFDLAKPSLMFLKFGRVSDLDSARKKGSRGMNAGRVSLF
jgi:hypothetical protein